MYFIGTDLTHGFRLHFSFFYSQTSHFSQASIKASKIVYYQKASSTINSCQGHKWPQFGMPPRWRNGCKSCIFVEINGPANEKDGLAHEIQIFVRFFFPLLIFTFSFLFCNRLNTVLMGRMKFQNIFLIEVLISWSVSPTHDRGEIIPN